MAENWQDVGAVEELSTRALARTPKRETGPVRMVGISTTAMTDGEPRFSTSDYLLDVAIAHAREDGCETNLIRLRDLKFRHCEGFYSKSAQACTWPCSITQMDPKDELVRVYEPFVHWADFILVSTPIRWGEAPGSGARAARGQGSHGRGLRRDSGRCGAGPAK